MVGVDWSVRIKFLGFRRPRDQPFGIYPDRPVRHHRGCFRQLLHLKICSTHHKDLSYKPLTFGYSPRPRCATKFTPASPPAVHTEAIISTYLRPQPAAAPPRGSGAWFAAQARLEQAFPPSGAMVRIQRSAAQRASLAGRTPHSSPVARRAAFWHA